MASLRFLFFLFISATSSKAADSACQLLINANAKIYTIPTHLYMTESGAALGGKTRTREIVYLNKQTYFQENGAWRVSTATPTMMEQVRKTAAASKPNMTCNRVREEVINGETAVLYSTHNQDSREKTDAQLWISKSRGVPLKLEMDMDVGGASGKTHRSMRYEYKNVKAPAGVH